MRTSVRKIGSFFRRPNTNPSFLKPISLISSFAQTRPTSFTALTPTPYLDTELSVASEVLHILATVPSIELALECLVPLFSSQLVSTVLEGPPPDVHSAFRFFNWASLRSHLRSRTSYGLMVSMLRRDPHGFDSAWECLGEIRSSGMPVAAHSFEALIYAFVESGMTGKAVESFERMAEFDCLPTAFVYNAVLSGLVKEGIFILAMAIYNQMMKSNCPPTRSTFNVLINCYCKEGKTNEALALFDEMSSRGFPPDTMVYNIIVHSLCRAHRMRDAVGLLDSMKRNGVCPCQITYNSILDGYCKLGQIDEALKFWEQFKGDGFMPRLQDYCSLIDGLFRSGKFDEACLWYDSLLRKNIQPDCVLYTVMIRGHAEVGKVEEAFSFLSEMTERDIKPDTFCYNTLIKSLCDVGHLDSARSLQLEISRNELFPDSATYTIIICGLCSKGLVLEAQQIFDEMGKQGCFPTIRTFNALINGLCKAGNLKEAHIMFCKMEMGRKPSVFLRLSQAPDLVSDTRRLQELVERLCDSGHVTKAYKLLHSLADSGIVQPDIYTYTILINSFCKAGDFNRAFNLIRDLQFRGLSPDAVTYGTLINGLQNHERFADALAIFDRMVKSGCTPTLSVYYIVMKALCRMGNFSQAVNLWFSHISGRNNISAKQVAYIAAAKKQFEQGSVEEMVRSLIKMDIECGSCSSLPYCIWLSGYCQAGKPDVALQLFAVLKEYNIDATPSSCALLIRALCLDWRIDPAVDIMVYMLKKGYKLDSRHGNFLLQRLWHEGKQDAAIELVSEMGHAGYKLEIYLEDRTKALLYKHDRIYFPGDQ